MKNTELFLYVVFSTPAFELSWITFRYFKINNIYKGNYWVCVSL